MSQEESVLFYCPCLFPRRPMIKYLQALLKSANFRYLFSYIIILTGVFSRSADKDLYLGVPLRNH